MKCGKIIGVGKTAIIYEYEKGKVLKLFNQGYPYEAVEKEYYNAIAIRNMDFAKPKVYELITYENRNGIIYDRVDGESLLDWVIRTGDLHECATCMAKVHKAIIENKVSNLPNYKDFLRNQIQKTSLTLDKQQEVLHMLDKLPDGNTLCHGDFHPGNIIISGEEAFVIDFMNICSGNYLYDVARTVFLVEYTPVPKDANDREKLLHFKKTLSDLYLVQMNVSREMIQDYLSVITVARKGECPDE